MIIWLASGNRHKKEELSAILNGHELRTCDTDGFDFNPDESGASFLENALIKARSLYNLLAGRGISAPVLADDSGLCVDALGGRPGIYSARYGATGNGKTPDAAEKNALLLEEIGDTAERGARFVCAMVLFWGEDRFYAAQETLKGEIVRNIHEARGGKGFGYDPILRIPELTRTVAELSEDEKNRISHRGKAARAIAQLLREGVPGTDFVNPLFPAQK
ncbi:MAG: non-canonical purine NTP pyrophosphatase [Treponema sp.]|jgi:XTP/dITP diphosphohydrolase|nr:non-canonical purine NTP pyrophosphatase [Treponema sp.]